MAAPSHREIIELWPSIPAFARAIGVTKANAKMMRARNRIPETRYNDVVAAIQQAGFPPITYAQLAEGATSRRLTNGQGPEEKG
jgi:hypothetical protein